MSDILKYSLYNNFGVHLPICLTLYFSLAGQYRYQYLPVLLACHLYHMST